MPASPAETGGPIISQAYIPSSMGEAAARGSRVTEMHGYAGRESFPIAISLGGLII
jgi:hypothetical protein